MASNIPMMSIVFVFLLSLCSVYSSNSSPSHSPTGFTLEVIPPYSPKSPLFIPNLTSEERMQMMFQHSHERAKYLDAAMLSSKSSNGSEEYSLEADTITQIPIKQLQKYSIVVEVGIGTFGNNNAYESYFLTMDTGSGTIWTQCEGCKYQHCYPQMKPYFPRRESKTYQEFKPTEYYTTTHPAEGTNSSGVLATETFTFTSSSSKSSSRQKKLANIVFGCGFQNYDTNSELDKTRGELSTYPIAGVFAMALSLEREDYSFIKQVEDKIGGRFSYCFVSRPIYGTTPPPMYLKFGSDIKEPRKFSTVPLYLKEKHGGYFVKLEGLGVNGERLNIDPKVFSSRDSTRLGPGGLLLDSGSEFSYIVKAAHDVLTKKIDSYFANFKKLVTKEGGVCYRRKNILGFTPVIPHVTLYLEGGAKLNLDPQSTFHYITKTEPYSQEAFCLGFIPKPFSLLGALQQVNHRFIYNVKSKTLQFKRVDCAEDG
ncbi:hypothetical protein RIF29_23037 [Crotalaria pallida]|uniref:Peptidase A1 domain-containing protein n=1 Tax=Crotalaria pallida TaxID=3830 RepID=A0AAN9F9L5_CROPI